MTPTDAQTLRTLITEYRDAAIEEAYKGGGDPVDVPELEQNLAVTKANLERFIHQLTTPAGLA